MINFLRKNKPHGRLAIELVDNSKVTVHPSNIIYEIVPPIKKDYI